MADRHGLRTSIATSTSKSRDALRALRRDRIGERHRLAGLDLGEGLLDLGVELRSFAEIAERSASLARQRALAPVASMVELWFQW